MSHIHLTGIAKVQQLNCATGKASTLSAINDLDTSTDTLVLILQEPWLTNSGQPPSSTNYDLFLPPGKNPRCATYTRKDLGLNARRIAHHKQTIVSVAIDLPQTTMEIINIYAPSGNETNSFLTNYTPTTNALIGGDFNVHHTMWYGHEATERTELIKNSKTKAEKLITFIQELGLTLQNTSGTFTHFSKAINYRNSIPNLTLTSGHVSTMT